MTFDEHIRVNEKLLLKFFLTFSKFEYALKESGFYRRSRYDNAEPYWNNFIESIEALFDKDFNDELKDACDFILINPPRKQVVKANFIMWETQSQPRNESETKFLIDMVKSIRNHLFHGAKFGEGLHDDSEGVTKLLESALIILKYTLSLNEHLKNNYENATI
jgi:hypothetical protein